jgi:type II secretory pathway component GspD/PulD (secretin)
VVLSGLVQDDSSLVAERLPYISRIPIIGKLFTAETKTREKYEMIIYLVPHIERETEKAHFITDEQRCMRSYKLFVLGELQ